MKYTYAYKTSDGTRHEEAMEAPSREAVFEALREKGIKAIKVVAADGSKANGEIRGIRKRVVFVLGALCLVLGAILALSTEHSALSTPHSALNAPDSSALTELRVKAAAVSDRHKAAMTLAGADREKVAKAIEEARKEARDLFQNILSDLPDERERQIAKSLYGELMIQVDISASK